HGASPLDSIGPLSDDLVVNSGASRRTDGNLHQTVWQPAGFCISLFRPHRHFGAYPPVDAAREHRPFLPRRSSDGRDHQGSPAPADQRVQPLGGRLRPQPQNSHRVGRKGRSQRRFRPSLPAAYAAPESLRRIFHSQEHGGRTIFPVHSATVSSGRSELPHHRPAALPLHSLLLLHPRRGAWPHVHVRVLLLAFPDHLLLELPTLSRMGTAHT